MSYEDEPMNQGGEGGTEQPRSSVADKVKLPAIFLIVAGVLNIFGAGYFILNGIVMSLNPEATAEQMTTQMTALNPNALKDLQNAGLSPIDLVKRGSLAYMIGGAVGVLAAVLTILGGVRMMMLKSYGLAVFASILAALPCISFLGCCGLGEGIGIWALIVLMSADTKAAFR
jgi:hypothetical protein